MITTIIGECATLQDATALTQALLNNGFTFQDISVIMKEDFSTNQTRNSIIAMIGGFDDGIGDVDVYDTGKILIGGPLAGSLNIVGSSEESKGGTIIGSVTGGLVNAFMSIGLTETDAINIQQALRQNHIVIAVSVNEETEAKAQEVFAKNQVENILPFSSEDLKQ